MTGRDSIVGAGLVQLGQILSLRFEPNLTVFDIDALSAAGGSAEEP